jgi:hypothetical protein
MEENTVEIIKKFNRLKLFKIDEYFLKDKFNNLSKKECDKIISSCHNILKQKGYRFIIGFPKYQHLSLEIGDFYGYQYSFINYIDSIFFKQKFSNSSWLYRILFKRKKLTNEEFLIFKENIECIVLNMYKEIEFFKKNKEKLTNEEFNILVGCSRTGIINCNKIL